MGLEKSLDNLLKAQSSQVRAGVENGSPAKTIFPLAETDMAGLERCVLVPDSLNLAISGYLSPWGSTRQAYYWRFHVWSFQAVVVERRVYLLGRA